MKIICTDNFNRDYVPDSLIAENLSGYWASRIVKLLNENTDPNGQEYYEAVSDEYVLLKMEP